MIEGKSPEQIRKTFNIKNDFTDEDESEVSTGFTIEQRNIF